MNLSTSPLTRRAFVGLLTATTAGVIASCDLTGNEKHVKKTLDGPNRLRAEAKTMEPRSYVKTYDVNPSGAGGAFKTIREAMEAVTKDKNARLGTASGVIVSNPWDWRRIRVAPGTYREVIGGVPPHTALIGTGSKPEDVYIVSDGDNTVSTTGRTCYTRNVHLDNSNLDPDVHAHRDGGSSGNIGYGDLQRRTVVFENVKFSSPERASLGKGSNDLMPRTGTTLVFHGCTFDTPGQPQSVNLVSNGYNKPGNSLIALVGCTFITNHSQHPSKDYKQLSEVDAAPLGVPDFGHGRRDRLLFMDGKWNVGKTHGVQALIVMPLVGEADIKNKADIKPGTEYYIVNPGSQPGMKTTLTENGARQPSSQIPKDLALPAGCMSADEATFFGVKPPREASAFGAGTKSGKLAVAKGDIYWVAIPLRKTALATKQARLAGAKIPGASVSLYLDEDGAPNPKGLLTQGTSKDGQGDIAYNLAWAYPGQGGHIWVAIGFNSDGEVDAIAAGGSKALKGNGFAPNAVPDATRAKQVSASELVPAIELMNQLPETMAV